MIIEHHSIYAIRWLSWYFSFFAFTCHCLGQVCRYTLHQFRALLSYWLWR